MLVDAILFLAPISGFDQTLPEVSLMLPFIVSLLTIVLRAGSKCQSSCKSHNFCLGHQPFTAPLPSGRQRSIVEINMFQQAVSQGRTRVVFEQM
jgi:hypothetical protein